MTTGFAYDSRFLDHHTGEGHPECPERLSAVMTYLEKLPWFSKLHPIQPKKSEENWVREVHSASYIRRASKACASGALNLDSPDVGISPKSFDTALLAAGASLELADHMLTGHIQNGFALVRPPGHHAEKDTSMGFCLFNNIARFFRV